MVAKNIARFGGRASDARLGNEYVGHGSKIFIRMIRLRYNATKSRAKRVLCVVVHECTP